MIQNKETRFEVTNKRNARCIMCPLEKMTRPQGILDMRLYKRVLDEACAMGVNVVRMWESLYVGCSYKSIDMEKLNAITLIPIHNSILSSAAYNIKDKEDLEYAIRAAGILNLDAKDTKNSNFF